MVTCPYCSAPATLTTGAKIYPHRKDLAALRFWECAPCGAWVGCHKGGKGLHPLGTLADAETRGLRAAVHGVFDPQWKGKYPRKTRGRAYRDLANLMKLPEAECHISMFTASQCRSALVLLRSVEPSLFQRMIAAGFTPRSRNREIGEDE